MLIPSIDLMDGKIVQLVQGEKKALEFSDFDHWIVKFSKYPLIQLIDLNAAMGSGDNSALVEMICRRLPCQVGGGIRTLERAKEVLGAQAQRVILGSSLLREGAIDEQFASACAATLGTEKLTFAIDARNGKIAIKGWKEATSIEPLAMLRQLERYCHAFLYTHIDTEGTMMGFPLEIARQLRGATKKQMIVAGGIRSMQEVNALETIGVHAVVGMAIYTDAIQT